MPAYDYICDKCGYSHEYNLPMEHEAPRHCNQPMRRLYSQMKFILKGEGWSLQGYEKPNAMMEREVNERA